MTSYHVGTNSGGCSRLGCNWIPVIIFAALFLFSLGLVLGAAVLAETVVANLAAFIILTAILFVLAVVAWLTRWCSCRNRCRE